MDGTREVWEKRVADWRSSGLDAASFAGQHGLSEASLKWWKWKLGSKKRARSKKRGAATLSPLTFVEMAPAVQSAATEIVLASGVRVRVTSDFDAVALGRLLDLLEGRK